MAKDVWGGGRGRGEGRERGGLGGVRKVGVNVDM